jgi:hypothetical protein
MKVQHCKKCGLMFVSWMEVYVSILQEMREMRLEKEII